MGQELRKGLGLLTEVPKRDGRIEMKLQESCQVAIKFFSHLCVPVCVHTSVLDTWGVHVGV